VHRLLDIYVKFDIIDLNIIKNMINKIKNLKDSEQGFTLLELLIVIVIIAILAGIVFVALDPATRFRDARDARRSSDVTQVLHAAKIDQVDNGGDYDAAITALIAGNVYMIGTCTTTCNVNNTNCDVNVTSATSGVDLTTLVTQGYLGAVPVSPNGLATWDAVTTGYTLTKNANGTLTVGACESENTTAISAVR